VSEFYDALETRDPAEREAAQFAALSRAESKRWGPIIKQAGIKLD